jgi:predicted regulator of Ras-like GTPase activity (Roadblock/LC7/MglB family)
VKEILQQLAGVHGVVGALAAGPRGELVASAFPPLFDELALHQVAGLFSDDTAALRKLTGPDGSLDLRYARGRAMAKPFAGGTVVVLATLSVDAQLLGLSMEQAARRLESAPRPGASAAAAPAPTVTAGLAVVPPDVAELREPLSVALVRCIGPVGDLVFAEAWAAWAAAAPPSRAGLQRLLPQLAREIDDPAEREGFLAEARRLVG